MKINNKIRMEVNPRQLPKKLLLLLCTAGLSAQAIAGNSWLSRSIAVNKDGKTNTYYATTKNRTKQPGDSTRTLFDITISLHNAPAGDNDASTNNGDEQETYEDIIRHFADAVCEQSNGGHHLAKVSIFKNNKHQAKADIIWTDRVG